MKTYVNRFHGDHLYLEIDENETASLRSSDFDGLIEKHRRPLQVMVSSDNVRLIGLLVRSGFVLKRKCYEMDVCRADLAAPAADASEAVFEAVRGTPDYAVCAEKMYRYYADTHAAVSPLTASRVQFEGSLPDTVLYSKKNGRIVSAAFIECSEIAYVFSCGTESFADFAGPLLAAMFARYDRIVFEADDTDPAAAELMGAFSVRPETSFDTYVKYP
ncbi:MAG: hypothetical protein J5586_01850 [Clostridia bacterium]|nr:hypothetical protein [Clostridia bacterium]